jgi:hypothetical protein
MKNNINYCPLTDSTIGEFRLNSVYVAIAGEVVNRRSVLLRNFVLNGKVITSNPLLHIHANRYGQGYETPQRNTSDKRTTLKVEAKTLCGDQRPK